MIIRAKQSVTDKEIKNLIDYFTSKGYQVKDASGETFKVFGIIGDTFIFFWANLSPIFL